MIRFFKLRNPDTLKWSIAVWIGWKRFRLTGFWFGEGYDV